MASVLIPLRRSAWLTFAVDANVDSPMLGSKLDCNETDMRSPIRKHLIATFRREFEKRYPQFLLVKIPKASMKIWECQAAPGLVLFVGLSFFEDEDTFVAEIAWNEEHEFPWMSIGDILRADAPRWRGRLGRLWAPHGKEPVWDLAPEVGIATQARFEAMRRGEVVGYPPPPAVEVVIPRITPEVDDCLLKVQQYGAPLFKQIAQNRGISDFAWFPAIHDPIDTIGIL